MDGGSRAMKTKADWCAAGVILALMAAVAFAIYGVAYYQMVVPCLRIQSERGGLAAVRTPEYRYANQFSAALFSPMHWADRTFLRPALWESISLYEPGPSGIPAPGSFQ
jgi:hypothetical protein